MRHRRHLRAKVDAEIMKILLLLNRCTLYTHTVSEVFSMLFSGLFVWVGGGGGRGRGRWGWGVDMFYHQVCLFCLGGQRFLSGVAEGGREGTWCFCQPVRLYQDARRWKDL